MLLIVRESIANRLQDVFGDRESVYEDGREKKMEKTKGFYPDLLP